ncbi:MAG: hypothetical protein RIB60_09320 [Phycisphaerales bacterium]
MPAWHDQFTTPDPDRLIGEIDPQHVPAHAALIKRLDGLDHLSEELRWMGVPWRWTIAYRDGSRDVAFIIPDPGSPKLAIPIALDRIARLESKKLPRTVRDGLAKARVVGEVAWAEWEIASQAAATDLGKFLVKLERELAGV